MSGKRTSISKAAAAERAAKLDEFLGRKHIQDEIEGVKPHKRVSWIREKFLQDSGINIPVSSIYKLLHDSKKSESTEETKTINESEVSIV